MDYKAGTYSYLTAIKYVDSLGTENGYTEKANQSNNNKRKGLKGLTNASPKG